MCSPKDYPQSGPNVLCRGAACCAHVGVIPFVVTHPERAGTGACPYVRSNAAHCFIITCKAEEIISSAFLFREIPDRADQ